MADHNVPLYESACGIKFDLVSQEQAENFLFNYYGHASKTSPEIAWGMTSPELRQATGGGEEDFKKDMLKTLWTEVMFAPRRSAARNSFVVNVRRYYDEMPPNCGKAGCPGSVDPVEQTVRLRLDANAETGVVMTSESGWSRPGILRNPSHPESRESGGDRDGYPWAVMIEPSPTYVLPKTSSDFQLTKEKEAQLAPRLRTLCEIMNPGDSTNPADSGLWTRTNQGWIKNSSLTVRGEPVGKRGCYPYVLQR